MRLLFTIINLFAVFLLFHWIGFEKTILTVIGWYLGGEAYKRWEERDDL